MSNFFADKMVLLPFDFSDESAAAIDEALGMVDDSTKLHVLHVLLPLHAISVEPGVIVEVGDDSSRIEATRNTMKERLSDKTRDIEFNVRVGDPGTEIVEYAKDIKADVIVMPSHGRTGIKRLLLGSVTERVLRIAECPVLVLRHAKKT